MMENRAMNTLSFGSTELQLNLPGCLPAFAYADMRPGVASRVAPPAADLTAAAERGALEGPRVGCSMEDLARRVLLELRRA